MKLWFLTFEIAPYFGGGLSTYITNIINMYDNTSDEVIIFARDPSLDCRVREEEYSSNVSIIRFKGGSEPYYAQFGYWPAVANEFAQHVAFYIKKHGAPDILEIPDGYGIGYICLQKKHTLDPLFKDLKIVTVAHTPTYFIDRTNLESEFKLPIYWHRQMERYSLAAADGVIWPSRTLKDALSNEISLNAPMQRVIHNPYHLSVEPQTRQNGENQRDHVFLASRLTYWKGVVHALNIMKPLWDNGALVPLRLYGSDTPYSHQNMQMSDFIKSRYSSYFKNNLIEICGNCPREEIDRAAKQAYAQIHPSLFDNFPYSAIECIANGNLLVMNKNVGVHEILEDRADYLRIDVDDITGSAETLLTSISMSDEQRMEIVENARSKVRKALNYKTIMEERHEFFEDVVNSGKRKLFPFLSCEVKKPAIAREGTQIGLLSIVIPFFNMAPFVEEAVRSAFNSDYPHKEIIIVDDGSTNKLDRKIVAEVAERYGATLITTGNQGVAAARNTGVQHASGEFVALLDSDDYVSTNYYSRAIQILNEYDNVSYVGCWIRDFNKKGTIRTWTTHNTELPTQIIFNLTNCQALVYRASVFRDAGQHDSKLRMFLDDWEATISLLASGFFGVMIPEALFHYRIRDESIFRSRTAMWVSNYEYIVDKHPDLYRSHAQEIVKFLNANGPNTLYHVPGFPSHYDSLASNGATPSAKAKKSWASRRWRRLRNSVRKRIPAAPVTWLRNGSSALRLW